jgi:hypothetical protein
VTHDELCERARRWLVGTRRCEPVFSNVASCDEIPDAIGWSSCHKWRGSTVVECKTSVADFYADRRKYKGWRNKRWGWVMTNISRAEREASPEEWSEEVIPCMGDYRLYMCYPGILAAELVAKHAPDHGLLYVEGRRIRTVIEATRRQEPNYPAEIRYLRFAIINGKTPHECTQEIEQTSNTEAQ